MKNEYLKDVFQQMEMVSKNAKTVFGNLNQDQLNWKPNQKSWSIGQCFDHLITTNKAYEKRLKEIIQDNYQPNFWEKRRWFTKIFKPLLMSATAPNPTKKTKTVPTFEPSKSNIPYSIIDDFIFANGQFIKLLSTTDKLNHEEFYISSPATNLIVYNLKTMCTMLGNHEERHFNQAKEVLEELVN